MADVNTSTAAVENVLITDTLDIESSQMREIGEDAVWSISSAKAGNGIEQLRENSTETYWQSDGLQPHILSIQFITKATIAKICMYVDSKADESYTPKKISIRCGSSYHDLVDIISLDLAEPTGWVCIPLKRQFSLNDSITGVDEGEFLRTFILQVRVHAMNQNGRDCHIRCVKLFTPRIASDALPVHLYKHQHVIPISKPRVEANTKANAMDRDSDSDSEDDGASTRRAAKSNNGKFVFSLKCNNQIIR